MNTWFTSDLHFFHKNILRYCAASRPFDTIEDMNAELVRQWNAHVSPQDTVWILGDVSFGAVEPTVEILNQLKGRKQLIRGNHDYKMMRHAEFRECFVSIDHYREFRHEGVLICLMHYPIASWNERNHGSFMLHGHSHGQPTGLTGRILDVGVDTNGLKPYNLKELYNSLKNVPVIKDFGD